MAAQLLVGEVDDHFEGEIPDGALAAGASGAAVKAAARVRPEAARHLDDVLPVGGAALGQSVHGRRIDRHLGLLRRQVGRVGVVGGGGVVVVVLQPDVDSSRRRVGHRGRVLAGGLSRRAVDSLGRSGGSPGGAAPGGAARRPGAAGIRGPGAAQPAARMAGGPPARVRPRPVVELAEDAADLIGREAVAAAGRAAVVDRRAVTGRVDGRRAVAVGDRDASRALVRVVLLSRADEEDVGVAAAHASRDHRAADADRADRQRDLHVRGTVLGDLAGDEPEHAFGDLRRDLAGVGLRVVDELVEDHVAVRADREHGLVEQQDLEPAVGAGRHVIVEIDRLAAADHAAGRSAGCRRLDVAAHRGGDADARQRGRSGRNARKRRGRSRAPGGEHREKQDGASIRDHQGL